MTCEYRRCYYALHFGSSVGCINGGETVSVDTVTFNFPLQRRATMVGSGPLRTPACLASFRAKTAGRAIFLYGDTSFQPPLRCRAFDRRFSGGLRPLRAHCALLTPSRHRIFFPNWCTTGRAGGHSLINEPHTITPTKTTVSIGTALPLWSRCGLTNLR